MFIKFVIFYPLFFLIENSLCKNYRRLDHEVGEVIFVNILYRHGERTPIDPYPNDPYNNLTFWPCDWGQLTNNGKLHHYTLGNWLRSRYSHLIPQGKYNNKVIHITSTDVDRTLMSAESNLAGMFPPGPTEVWSGLRWQPIPVHTSPQTSDKLLAMKAPCKRYDELYKQAMKSSEMKAINEKYKSLYEYLTLHSGKKVEDLDGVDYIYSTLLIETLANYTLPKWTEKVYPEPMREASGLSFSIPTFTTELKRLKAGPLVKEMLENMSQKVNGKLERNISVYSGHDTTVGSLLNTLGLYNKKSPPFAAMVLIELRRSNKDNLHYVTVLYKNSSGNPHVLTIPGCSDACTLDEVHTLLNDVIPDDWESECHSHDLFDLSNEQPYHSLAIFEKLGIKAEQIKHK